MQKELVCIFGNLIQNIKKSIGLQMLCVYLHIIYVHVWLKSFFSVSRPTIFLPARYFLQPRDNGNKSLKPDDLGSLRLNVVYTEDHVFSSDYYSPLRDLLLKSADVEVIYLLLLVVYLLIILKAPINICHFTSEVI